MNSRLRKDLIAVLLLIATSLSMTVLIMAQEPDERYRPLIGGIRIETLDSKENPTSGWASTLGYAARNLNTGQLGIVVSAHVVVDWKTSEEWPYVYQPEWDQQGENYIGRPNLISQACDGAFVPYNNVDCKVLVPRIGIYPVVVYYEFDEVWTGMPVCVAGQESGYQCLYIEKKIMYGEYPVSYIYLVYPSVVYEGDSGAPWFHRDGLEIHGEILLVGHTYAIDPDERADIVVSITSDKKMLSVEPLLCPSEGE